MDTIPEITIVADSLPKTVFEPSPTNGKEAAAGSVVFGIVATFLNVISVVSNSTGPAAFAFVSSLTALILACISTILSRKRKNRVPFSSLNEYKVTRKKARTGAILAALGFIISIICMAAFFTFTLTL